MKVIRTTNRQNRSSSAGDELIAAENPAGTLDLYYTGVYYMFRR